MKFNLIMTVQALKDRKKEGKGGRERKEGKERGRGGEKGGQTEKGPPALFLEAQPCPPAAERAQLRKDSSRHTEQSGPPPLSSPSKISLDCCSNNC